LEGGPAEGSHVPLRVKNEAGNGTPSLEPWAADQITAPRLF
jgi:hypothetical protein